jgi:hypothetical protein
MSVLYGLGMDVLNRYASHTAGQSLRNDIKLHLMAKYSIQHFNDPILDDDVAKRSRRFHGKSCRAKVERDLSKRLRSIA